MLMEGRGSQQASAQLEQKAQPPSCKAFQTKVAALISRARSIRNAPHKTLAHLIDKEWLKESWKNLRKGASYGIDAVSYQDYSSNLEDNLTILHKRLKGGRYNPAPVRRVHIPKPDGRTRPLGLPTIEDKVAQNAVSYVLSTIYEQEFLPISYGFRPGKSAHQAIEKVKASIAQGKVSWIVDADIESFFDSMNHEWLMKFINHKVADKRILSLIRKWLSAGIMEEGKITKASSGSPQGGVISPLLANIYLHYVLDLWVTKTVRKQIKGEMHSIRYADDVLFCFQYRQDAINFLNMLKTRFKKFDLKLSEEKTQLCRFGKYAKRDCTIRGEKRATFNFLGFTLYNGISRQGKYMVGCRTQSRRLNAAMNKVTTWCKENRHQAIAWQARYLNAMLQGHYNYYGVTGNFKSVAAFYRHVVKVWRRYLSRRSQRAKIGWEKYMRILKTNPLKKAHLPHTIYATH